MNTKRDKDAVSLGDAISRALERIGLDEKLRRKKALLAWEEVVGAEVAKVTKPLRLKNGILFVAVSAPAWINELIYYGDVIARKLNRIAGNDIVKSIRWQNASDSLIDEETQAASVDKGEIKFTQPDVDLDSPLEEKLEKIDDVRLKKALRRLFQIAVSDREAHEGNKNKEDNEEK